MPGGINDKSSQADFLVSMAGVADFWSTCSGGVPSVQQSESWDGGATQPDLEMSNPSYSDVTITRPYRALRDAPLASSLRPRVGQLITTVTKQPTDRQKKKLGVKPTIYSVVLKSVADPDTDAGAAATGTISLTFGCNGVK